MGTNGTASLRIMSREIVLRYGSKGTASSSFLSQGGLKMCHCALMYLRLLRSVCMSAHPPFSFIHFVSGQSGRGGDDGLAV
ncbi:hypothetical protein AKJ16_DCAP20667 [Drosera capensis]